MYGSVCWIDLYWNLPGFLFRRVDFIDISRPCGRKNSSLWSKKVFFPPLFKQLKSRLRQIVKVFALILKPLCCQLVFCFFNQYLFPRCQNVDFAHFVYFHTKQTNMILLLICLLLVFFDFLCARRHRRVHRKLQSVLIHDIFKTGFAMTKNNNNNNKYK